MRGLLLVVALALAGCAGTAPSGTLPAPTATPPQSDSTPSACERAFVEAAAIDDLHASYRDLDPAIEACQSVAEWRAAAAAHTTATTRNVRDPVAGAMAWLAVRCGMDRTLAATKLCNEVAAVRAAGSGCAIDLCTHGPGQTMVGPNVICPNADCRSTTPSGTLP